MEVLETPLEGVLLITPRVFQDSRGFFLETFSTERYHSLGVSGPFVQDNWSRSTHGVLRGLHYQVHSPQGKLIQVTRGAVFDVAVDLRRASPAFGRWYGVTLSDEARNQLWIPPGFAHGFLVLSDVADVVYKCTAYYSAASERTVIWNDPSIGIQWPLEREPVLSDKDRQGRQLVEAETF